MKIGEAFPSSYLKTDDLGGRRVLVMIDRVAMEDLGDEKKPIVYFRGKEKGLVLNKTNAGSISEIARTDETDRWRGVSVVLYPSKTDFQGRRVGCIRIDPPTRVATSPAPPPPPPEPVHEEVPAGEFVAGDEDVPF